MLDIKELLEKLSICNKIDFSGKGSELELLAEKYDKNHNSVFEEDEIQEMKDDLLLSAKNGGNEDELSDEEASAYFKSISPEKEGFFRRFIKRIGKAILPEDGRIARYYRKRQIEKNTSKLDETISELITTGEENKKDIIAKKMLEVQDRIIMYNFQDEELLKFKTTDLERLIDLMYVKERGYDQLSAHGLKNFVELSDEELERAKKYLLHVEGRKQEFSSYEIAFLSKLSEDELKRAQKYLFSTVREEEFNFAEIAILAKLSEDELKRAQYYLFGAKKHGRKEEFECQEIANLAKLTEDELLRATLYLFNTEGRKEEFNYFEIEDLAKLSEDELYWAQKNLFQVEKREEQFTGFEIATLAKVENKEVLVKYLGRNDFDAYTLKNIVNNYSKDLEEYLKNSPVCNNTLSDDHYVRFDNFGLYYTFDKSGLVERGYFNLVDDSDEINNGCMYTYRNKKLNIKHEQVYGEHGETHEFTIIGEALIYYDKNNNIIKTVTIKRNPENGFLNVSETDKEGNQIPIQWESIDPDTGSKITERYLTSPEGVKTEYYAEESDNLRITDYEIIDKDGNELINIHQTFQQVSENKFISSINITGNDKDTQIYEIEYTEDNIVKIYDKKNDEITEIDLKQYLSDELSAEKLMPIIKQLPGHVLLEFTEKPFNIMYNPKTEDEEDNEVQNGSWNCYGNRLVIGNHENAIGEKENLLHTIVHELGHYIDHHSDNYIISSNQEIIDIYNEELKAFQASATIAQQLNIEYFTNGSGWGVARGHEEKVAETHSILNVINSPKLNLRQFYLAQYFPRTMAAIMKLLLAEEGVKV